MSFLEAQTISKARRKRSVGGLGLDMKRGVLSLLLAFALELTTQRQFRLKHKRLHITICFAID